MSVVLLCLLSRPPEPYLAVAPPLPSLARAAEPQAQDKPEPANRFGVVIRWNTLARELVARGKVDPPMASRIYAMLSLAQHDAVAAADAGRARGFAFSLRAAATGAGAKVLLAAFPKEVATISRLAAGCRGTAPADDEAWTASTDLGEAAGDLLIRACADDGSDKVWRGEPPKGDGMWTGASPLRPLWGEVRTWLPQSSRCRVTPPPAPGSPEFLAGLDAVRRVSDSRTPTQLAIAKRHAFGPGTPTPPGFWNEVAVREMLTTSWRGDEADRRASRLLAVLNMALMDAGIVAWKAKYQTWLCRPSQADPAITLPIGLPPFPSYVSGHSAFSGAASRVLARAFPSRAAHYTALAEEASQSRVFGGIHYPFDCAEGLRLGREIGDEAAGLLK